MKKLTLQRKPKILGMRKHQFKDQGKCLETIP